MRALLSINVGPPEELAFESISDPKAGITVAACAVNDPDDLFALMSALG
jgi:hypothetical protein